LNKTGQHDLQDRHCFWLNEDFTTQNTHEASRWSGWKLVGGPFSKLDEWTFTPVGDDAQRACRVALIDTTIRLPTASR
jgi:ribosome-associated toxin RatA of RatAB toxin-antitoxin module